MERHRCRPTFVRGVERWRVQPPFPAIVEDVKSIPPSDTRVSTIQDKDQHWIVIDDPLTKNALDESLLSALSAAVESTESAILVLTGKNGGFSSGGGLAMVSELAEKAQSDVDAVASIVRRGGNLIEDLLFSSSTTVALIDGACAGAGLGIALACDYRIATDRSRFTTAYGKLGLPSDFGTYELLRRQVGTEAADDLMKTSETIGITKATELGLVDALIERLDRKGVKKALKSLPSPDRENRIKDISAILDAEAVVFAQALAQPETQLKVEKVIRRAARK